MLKIDLFFKKKKSSETSRVNNSRFMMIVNAKFFIHASSMGYFIEKSYNKFILQRRQL